MKNFLSTVAAAKTATLLLVVSIVVASTLLVVYNNQQTTTAATATTGSSGKKTNHGLLHSASVNSIAQQERRQHQQQQQQQARQRRNQQQVGGEEQVTVGGWNSYEDMTIPISTATTNSESNSNKNDWNSHNTLYMTEMTEESNDEQQLYSSSPFRPRQYSGTGTSYLHFKNSKEKDTDGHTTFPPTFAPILLQSGWFQPTTGPTLLMESITSSNPTYMSGEPTLGPTVMMENSRVPTKYPIMITLEPTKEEEEEEEEKEEVVVKEENEWLETDEPTLSPSGAPIVDPTGSPSKLPTLVPTLGPSLLPTRLPNKEPSKEPIQEEEMTERPSQSPQRDPTRTPYSSTIQPISTFSAIKPNDGGEGSTFFCGSNVYEARKCNGTPCPNGISDCTIGFCYAVSECLGRGEQPPPPPPPSPPSPPPVQDGGEVEEETPQPSLAPAILPTMEPIMEEGEPITKRPTRSPIQQLSIHDFYCGSTYIEASSNCNNPCPTGSPTECPNNMKCYASVECSSKDKNDILPMQEELSSPSYSPSKQPSPSFYSSPDSFYCGSSFQEAAETCTLPCPNGLSASCPPNMACYANTPCPDKGGFYCGTNIVNASASCDKPCSSGLDSECALGLTCYETQTCQRRVPPPMMNTNTTTTPNNQEPKVPNVEDGTKYCGTSYEHASTTCAQPCPRGKEDCPDGMSCYAHTPCEEKKSFYCGLSWNNAASSCQLPCATGSDEDCPAGTHCYAYTTCDRTETFMCGATFEEASASCNKPCPSGKSSDCPENMSCFTHTTCSGSRSTSDSNSPPPPAGTNLTNDNDQTSPPEVDGVGEQTSPENEGDVNSFPPTATPEEYIPGDSYYCGTSFLDASMQCTHPCPSRSDSECPNGEQCYGNTPCPTRETYYCGANLNEASSMCNFPCPSGKSLDCPTGLSCFAFTTCADKDTFYCGNNFVEAGSNCDTPCPSGLSSECPENLTCFAHTQCGKEPMEAEAPKGPAESNFCGASFDEATRHCSLPCPTGSECPSGLTCFSHTSCADRDSFMCGYSWDHASATCSNPCPSGEHSDCPNGMRCFAYTPCNNEGSFYCGTSVDEAASCEHPCPTGSSDECPDNLSCFSYTSCGTGDFDSKPPTTAPSKGAYEIGDSFYCGKTFQEASSSCEHKCPNGSADCPDGLKCFEFTTCVGQEEEEPISEEVGANVDQEEEEPIPQGGKVNDSYFCGKNLVDANEKCQVPCKDGTSDGCPPGESCIPFTSCNEAKEPESPPLMISNSFYCGKSKEDAEASCDHPCPRGSSDCHDDMMCFSFTTCASSPTVPSTTPLPPGDENADPNSFYCGTSFEDATSSCGVPCEIGSSSECPAGQSCYGYTSCNDRESFYCGMSWEHAASQCSKPCPTGSNDECDADEVCFGYTPCNSPDLDIPVESFYCGTTFEEASIMCKNPCPSGKHSDCASGELCHPYTPCGERYSNFCGSSWVDAATSCLVPCPSGSSADCPEDQFCFPSTPCDEVNSFFCGTNFEDATTTCSIPCTSGRSNDCPDGQGCFAYTLCSEFGTNAVPTPTLAPTPIAPSDSFYCGGSFDDASAKCDVPCPSGSSDECPGNLLCFASTPCSDKGSFFCGSTWEIAAATCTQPCESGMSSDCPDNQQCFGYTPCTKSESFFCGTSFDQASTTCSNPCPSGLDSDCPNQQTCFKYTPCNDTDPLEEEPSVLPYPVDTYYCGNDFVDASTMCNMPCRSGSAAECPVGQACFGNTSCGGDDSFYCGLTWLDASSECKDPCATDKDCPQGTKCFGYTSCSNTDSFYCGSDFKDASSTCSQPCPSGFSSDCPSGLACFPNTPCAKDPSATIVPLKTLSPTEPQTKAPTRLPTSSPTLSLLELKGTTSPSTIMPRFCGLDEESIDCSLPCTKDAECPLDHKCHATQECATQTQQESIGDSYFYCGKDFNDASASCPLACPSGSSVECADLGPEYSCFASTPCGDKDSYYCGTTWSHAASNCLFPCASGSDSECPDDTFCFPYTSCDKNESFMCGTSFEDASSCERACPSGSSSECAFGESCFTRTTCGAQESPASTDQKESSSGSFFCGTSFGDATSSCDHACPSGSSDDCPGDLLCFAGTSCEASDSFFCGASFEAAASSCTIPCKNGLSSDCPIGEKCYGYTPCTSSNTFYCGLSFEEASSTCDQPCPSGSDSECSGSATCHKYTTCADGVTSSSSAEKHDAISESFFCGFSFQDASDSCEVACPGGSSSDCGAGRECFPHTTCATKNPETFFCGTTISDANMSCTHSCSSSSDCPNGESCFAYTTCVVPKDSQSIVDQTDSELVDDVSSESNMETESIMSSETYTEDESMTSFSSEIPSESYYCGLSYENASTTCSVPCPDRDSSKCPDLQQCYAYTPCAKPESFFCGNSIDDANEACAVPCRNGASSSCPNGQSCYAYTECVVSSTNTLSSRLTSRPTNRPPTSNPTSKPTLYPTEHPTKSPTESPTLHPITLIPTEFPSKFPTKFPTNIPTKSPIIPVFFDVPEDSFYCGVTFNHASELCDVPCPGGDEDCPNGLTCFGNTPCGDKGSFFCGTSYKDASSKCASQCQHGAANECPSGESCFAYTECKPVTEMPTEQPTDPPSWEPTQKPISSPVILTKKPSLEPTLSPVSTEPTLNPVTKVIEPAESDAPVEEVKEPVEEEEKPIEEEAVAPAKEVEEPTEEEQPNESEALVIELKPCEDPLSMTVNQAYWRSWSSDRPETCNKFEVADIDATTYTHLVYSFASISADGHLEPWVGSWDEVDKYREFNKVKERNPNVKTLIAVTAGVFYGAGMTPVTFNEVAETEKTRMAFAQSVVTFLELYEFDGIDIDWETPLSEDNGGSPENFERFVALAEEIRLAFESSAKKFIFTITLPPTDWELLDYDIVGLSEHVDWFNLMSFDYHTPENIPKTVGAHSDLKLIDSVIFELLKGTISTKFVLGMAAYGRTYTLADDRCLELGCPFRSPGLGGCGNTPGFLPFNEIHEYIQSKSYDAVYQDVSSSSMVAVVGGDQMISYDDETTWAIKEAYAEMMCLRGTMLWSVDMLKAKSSSSPQAVAVEDVGTVRSLSTANSPSERCTLCSDGMILAEGVVYDNGVQASCSDIHNRLDATFVPILSDQCIETISMFGKDCCIAESFRSCDICDQGARTEMLDDKSIVYAGSTTTCRALTDSFHHTKGSSFKCSLARSLMTSSCCAEPCNICPSGGAIKHENTIELDGKKVGCADAELSLKQAGVYNGSDQCSSFVSRFSDMCCSQVENKETISLDPQTLSTPCNVCLRNHIHHELNSEAVIEYKGSSISCLDLNSILARNEFETSNTCRETQSELFESCCYEKCSLCGDKSLRWDSTVKFNDQIISCHELGSMFTLGTVREGSDQCDAIQSAYSSACCYSPPNQKCNLCDFGSVSLEVNVQSFVKSSSSSIHCMNLVENLAEREEEGSQVCEDSKLVFSTKCCNTSQSPTSDDSYYVWLASHLSGPSPNAGTVITIPFMLFVMTQLLVATCILVFG